MKPFWREYRKLSLPRWPENKIILIYALVGTLILGYNDYAIYREVLPFDALRHTVAFLFSLIGATIAVYAYTLSAKAYGLTRGLLLTPTFNAYKVAIGLFIILFSTKAFVIPLIFAPDFKLRTHEYRRIGAYPPGINIKDNAKVGLVGVSANLAIAGLLQFLFGITNPLVNGIIVANAFSAIANILPVPNSPGFSTLYTSIALWGSLLGIIVFSVMLLYTNVLLALIIGLSASVACYLLFKYRLEELI